jgi:hypothetical protein
MEENIVEKIKRILLTDPEVKVKWDDLTHITSIADALNSFKLLFFFIKKLVYVIEIVQAEFGGMEKEERIDYAAQVLDDLISFSGWAFWLEAVDYMFFKFAISQVVAALDDRYGTGSWFTNYDAIKNIDKDELYIKATRKEF